jgi:hypothetical protein
VLAYELYVGGVRGCRCVFVTRQKEQDPKWLFAWQQADKEATRSMYSFRKHYNYYDQQEAGKDWSGTKSEYFNAGSQHICTHTQHSLSLSHTHTVPPLMQWLERAACAWAKERC